FLQWFVKTSNNLNAELVKLRRLKTDAANLQILGNRSQVAQRPAAETADRHLTTAPARGRRHDPQIHNTKRLSGVPPPPPPSPYGDPHVHSSRRRSCLCRDKEAQGGGRRIQ